MNSDLYIKVDLKLKKIIDYPKTLDVNWNNISGLCYLSDQELSNLSWAGYPDIGFLKYDKNNIENINLLSFDNVIFLQMKEVLKETLCELRYRHETNGVIINDRYQLSTNDRSKILMQGKYLECIEDDSLSFEWKTQSGAVTLNSKEFIKIFKEIQKFIQKTFDVEILFFKKIDSCNTIFDLFLIDINSIEWNSNKITL